jgi:stage IV sporulation protein B
LHERIQTSKRRLRGGAAACLAALLLFPVCTGRAAAAELTGAAVPATNTGQRMLVPVGHTVGIKLFSRGVLVVGLAEGGSPAKSCGLEKGDVILTCNGNAVTSTEQFQSALQTNRGDAVTLQVSRADRRKTLTAHPTQNEEGDWVIGAWIRDSMAGIGTMTYYDPATNTFGALGHGITDTDTAQLMPFSSGSILPSTVKAVKMGQAGAAGELRGDFDLDTCLGQLSANTDRGVFGTLENTDFAAAMGNALPVAEPSEVQNGPATILANVEGDTVKEYQVELTKLSPGADDPRDLLITVTDPELLAATGGIVQGMSGSPILQNGTFVGAVTHVLLHDPTKGYGIFIETMLENSSLQAETVA